MNETDQTVGLRDQIAELRYQTVGLRDQIAELRFQKVGLRDQIAELKYQTAGLREMKYLNEQIKQLDELMV